MDTEPEVKKEKTHPQQPFYCNICKISCASALNLQTHFLGFKHKTVEEALKAHGIIKTVSGTGDQAKAPVKLPDYVQTEPEKFQGQTLEEQLNTCKDSEPALGLQYIIEYRSKENFLVFYECQLCHCKAGLSNMFMHVYGSKHRLAYLKQHYPEIADSDEAKGRGSDHKRRVKQIAALIEKKEGRKTIKVVMDHPVMKRKWQEFGYPSKAKVQHVDASASNEGMSGDDDKDKQVPDSTQSLPSQDGKDTQDEQEKSQKEQPKAAEKLDANKADKSSKGDKADENSIGDKTECDESKQSKGEEGKKEVQGAQPTAHQRSCLPLANMCDESKQSKGEEGKKEVQGKRKDDEIYSEEFTCHEELLGYLRSFEILSEDDASFILKITQTLTNALVEYRLQIAPTKDSLDSEPNQEESTEHSTEQSDMTSVDISDSNTGIDIPNVIRILTESGTLRAPNSDSMQ
ncbi:cylicin-1-like isoform X2 [Emydura macquarii macquarii]|uniref:cylicin-1-like isoform X2 n=1 Tax=Emydura macquarii macquarii TaxID=1129001 RepID=UPI00352B5112